MGQSKQTVTFNVIIGAGTAVMEPYSHRVHVRDIIHWVTEGDSMRVVVAPPQQMGIRFTGSGGDDGVTVGDSISTPEGVMVEGTAVLPGNYYHTAIVWQGERPPVCAVGVLIIDP